MSGKLSNLYELLGYAQDDLLTAESNVGRAIAAMRQEGGSIDSHTAAIEAVSKLAIALQHEREADKRYTAQAIREQN